LVVDPKSHAAFETDEHDMRAPMRIETRDIAMTAAASNDSESIIGLSSCNQQTSQGPRERYVDKLSLLGRNHVGLTGAAERSIDGTNDAVLVDLESHRRPEDDGSWVDVGSCGGE
jgi:hypothetical protein